MSSLKSLAVHFYGITRVMGGQLCRGSSDGFGAALPPPPALSPGRGARRAGGCWAEAGVGMLSRVSARGSFLVLATCRA